MKSYGRVKKRYVTQVTKWLHNFNITLLQHISNFITIKIKEAGLPPCPPSHAPPCLLLPGSHVAPHPELSHGIRPGLPRAPPARAPPWRFVPGSPLAARPGLPRGSPPRRASHVLPRNTGLPRGHRPELKRGTAARDPPSPSVPGSPVLPRPGLTRDPPSCAAPPWLPVPLFPVAPRADLTRRPRPCLPRVDFVPGSPAGRRHGLPRALPRVPSYPVAPCTAGSPVAPRPAAGSLIAPVPSYGPRMQSPAEVPW